MCISYMKTVFMCQTITLFIHWKVWFSKKLDESEPENSSEVRWEHDDRLIVLPSRYTFIKFNKSSLGC